MTLWTLDTCGFDIKTENCQILINDQTGTETYVRRCPAHQTATEAQAHEENTRGKSNVEWEMLDGAPSSLFDTLPDGTRQFKNGINVTWTWSGTVPNRVLNVNVTGVTLTQNQQNSIKNKLNNRFGINNVVLTFS